MNPSSEPPTSVKADVDARLSGLVHALAVRHHVRVQVVAGALLAHGSKDEAFLRAWKPAPGTPPRNPTPRRRGALLVPAFEAALHALPSREVAL